MIDVSSVVGDGKGARTMKNLMGEGGGEVQKENIRARKN